MNTKKNSYSAVRNTFQNKINWYRTLCNQTMGAGTSYRPTPTQLSSFAKWIDKGATLQNVTATQLNRWCGGNRSWTVSAVRNTLADKFGKNCIKAVAFNKSGGFIVVTTPTRQGKTFRIN
jgi:hypothetical protein